MYMKSTNDSGFHSTMGSKKAQINNKKVERRGAMSRRHSKMDFGAARRLCQYRQLGTLGDPSVPGATCSEHVALRCGARHVVPYPSFEAAAGDVMKGKIEVVFVPAAYPDAFHFIQSADLILVDTFVVRIPPLVVAGPLESNGYGRKLFYPAATAPLLPEIRGRYEMALTVYSNVEACKSILEERGTICITNSICAEQFNLQVFQTIRSGVLMPFYIFAAAKIKKVIICN